MRRVPRCPCVCVQGLDDVHLKYAQSRYFVQIRHTVRYCAIGGMRVECALQRSYLFQFSTNSMVVGIAFVTNTSFILNDMPTGRSKLVSSAHTSFSYHSPSGRYSFEDPDRTSESMWRWQRLFRYLLFRLALVILKLKMS